MENSKFDCNKISTDYQNGLSLKEIRNKWDISYSSIYRMLRKSKTSLRKKTYSSSEINRMFKMYRSNVPLTMIGKEFDVTGSCVWHILDSRNMILNKGRKILDSQIPDIIKDYKKGLSTLKIAKKYKVTKATISYWLKKSGVNLKSPIEWNKTRRKRIKLQKGLTKAKSLLLGMLLADGSESKRANNIMLSGLDKFTENFSFGLVKKIYGIEGQVYFNKYRIVWHSENMRDDI